MSYRLPPLRGLQAFEAAARHMSFRDAASELSVTPSALSHQIRQLEGHLGLSLFKRLNRQVLLTEAGERIFPGIREGFMRLHETMALVGTATPDHVLVVSTGPSIAAKWLTPRVLRFMERYPDIEMRISASMRLADFAADEVDVGIRFGSGRYPDLYCEPLVGEWVTPMIAPERLRAGDITAPVDLAKLSLLHDGSMDFSAGAPRWRDWFAAAGVDRVDAEKGPRFNHADHALDAAIRGAGAVLGRSVLAADEVRTGRLVMPFPDVRVDTRLVYSFVCPKVVLEREKVQFFRSWITEEFARPDGHLR